MINLWEIRNREVHGINNEEIEEKERRVTNKIEQYFSLTP